MALALQAVEKSYGTQRVLQPVDLEVADGEFLTILGPSGSGKTTILRLVGGFTRPSGGRIRFGGVDLTDVPSHKRPFNTVFQDYALFPHMTVADNVGYGLMVRGLAKSAIRGKVEETLEIVGLGGLLDRYPAQLSGGQKQRVALARAIVCEPKLILLDEPLAALDAEMRRQMQFFLKDLQRRIATTFLFVTHDQEEAITMSDRIVVMDKGRIEQIGAPTAIYYSPKTPFVARFFGDNNLVAGEVRNGRIETPMAIFPLPANISAGTRAVLVAVRPEKIEIGAVAGGVDIACTVEETVFIGAMTQLRVRPLAAPETTLLVKKTSDPSRPPPQRGSKVTLSVGTDAIAIVEAAP
ncbi:ABC transporter ATP-binding protein [Mesorhizobium sp. AR07]|uniref:ABC transporter ATP-binding protein n=1 Tax=Mesorhizobium sp. AR07 TaxID=2865838 RepID=UPI00215E126D|nr:ABC transporter ATP-binding protein [Mesorhizobium sp. AR07]UVK43860.1 ABC transporter ATP-binding protein [Mesorhizobium sp. AR07]